MGGVQGRLKINKWWNSHLLLMTVAIYYQLALAKPSPPLGAVLLTMVLFLITTVGIASFGQLLNDLYDVEQDIRSGSNNLIAGRSRAQIVFRFLLVFLIAGLPWLALPMTHPILILIAVEYALFIAYSVPPIRLKNRGLFGPIADALYGYTIPMSVSLLLFGRLGHVSVSPWFVTLMMLWSFLLGLEQILAHQLKDAARDQLDKIQTFVVHYGWQPTFLFMERILFPAEATTYAALLLAMGTHVPAVPIGFALYAAWMAYRWKTFGILQTRNMWQMPVIDRLFFYNLILMSRFKNEWFSLLILIVMVYHSPAYIFIVFLHLSLFQNGVKTLVKLDIPEMRRLGRIV